MVALGDVASVISRSSYLFGVSWPDVRRTLLVAVEQDGDPYRNTFGSSFTRFSPNDCVQAGIIKNHVSSATPSNSATGKSLSEAAMGWLFSSTALSGYVDVSTSNLRRLERLVVGSDRTSVANSADRVAFNFAFDSTPGRRQLECSGCGSWR
jgi:hypothetical protein